ncbi:trypsin domain-containing protein [Phthorimaea operculella]|nr:trypsin domain-containing protein [Phthorimaea operculella]
MFGKLVFMLLPVFLSAQCNESGCRQLTTRSLGGEPIERNSRPFQVALYTRVGADGELGFCGGALVHQQWVLTAAHCCFHDGQLVTHVQAILGAHSLYDRYENGRRIVNVETIEIHPEWNPNTFANDLALLKLANVVQLTDTINVVRLPYLSISQFNFAGAAGTISGWGIAAPAVTFVSPTLRQRVLSVTTDSFCNTQYENQLPNNIICGTNQTGGTCKVFINETQENIAWRDEVRGHQLVINK